MRQDNSRKTEANIRSYAAQKASKVLLWNKGVEVAEALMLLS